MLKPKIYNKIYVVVVDGDIAAFMTMEKFQNSAYGITDYQGGGHNFWIPFMMSGGRSGAGYIMTVDLPPLQAELFVDALKKQKGSKYSEIASYVFSHASMSPLPEFQDRMSWAGSRIEEIVNEDGSEHPTTPLQTLIHKASVPQVSENVPIFRHIFFFLWYLCPGL